MVSTHVPMGSGVVYVRAWAPRTNSVESMGIRPEELADSIEVPGPRRGPGPIDEIMRLARMLTASELEHLVEVLDKHRQFVEGQELERERAEEQAYCSCGLGVASGGRSHPPSCRVWGLPAQTQPAGMTGMTGTR
jgi:hypothetical protein